MNVKSLLTAGTVALAASTLLVVSGCTNSDGPATSGSKSKAGSILKTDAGEVKVVGVDAVAKNPTAHAGPVAIEGVVAQVIASRGAFTMIDVAEFAACGRTDCAQYSVPVLVPTSEFQGELPKHKEAILAIGEVEPLEKGFRFVIQEVRRNDTVILSRTKTPAATNAGATEEAQLPDCLPKTLLANKDVVRLTADQIAKLNAIQHSLTEAREPLQKKLTHCQEELVELLEEQPVDQAKVDHEKKEIAELNSKLAEKQHQAEQAARAVLSPEQLKKIADDGKAKAPC